MSIVDLALVKSHLRVDDDAGENALIAAYVDAAEGAASDYLNRNVYGTQEDVDSAIERAEDRPMLANPAFTAAVLFIVADMYANREAGANVQPQLSDRAIRLLTPYRVGWGV